MSEKKQQQQHLLAIPSFLLTELLGLWCVSIYRGKETCYHGDEYLVALIELH